MRHCVRWGPSPTKMGHSPPLFGPCLLSPNWWMDEDATWYEGRRRLRRHCYMGSQLPRRGIAPTILGPCLLWPNDWIGQDATIGTEVILGPGDIVLDEDPVPPPPKMGAQRHSPSLIFGPCIVAKVARLMCTCYAIGPVVLSFMCMVCLT